MRSNLHVERLMSLNRSCPLQEKGATAKQNFGLPRATLDSAAN